MSKYNHRRLALSCHSTRPQRMPHSPASSLAFGNGNMYAEYVGNMYYTCSGTAPTNLYPFMSTPHGTACIFLHSVIVTARSTTTLSLPTVSRPQVPKVSPQRTMLGPCLYIHYSASQCILEHTMIDGTLSNVGIR